MTRFDRFKALHYLTILSSFLFAIVAWFFSQSLIILVSGLLVSSLIFFLVTALMKASQQHQEEYIQKQQENDRKQQELLEKLNAYNDDMAQLAHIASHDVNSPLRGIVKLTEWLKEDCIDLLPEKSLEYLVLIQNSTKNLKRLLDELVRYARIEDSEIESEEIDLNSFIDNLAQLHILPANFTYELILNCDSVVLPKQPLDIILYNLMMNSIKHHDKDTGKITIEVSEDSASYYFIFSDDGPGVPANISDKAFRMFTTSKPRGESGSGGMGLAFVRKILLQHGGRIKLLESSGRGATFQIKWSKDVGSITDI